MREKYLETGKKKLGDKAKEIKFQNNPQNLVMLINANVNGDPSSFLHFFWFVCFQFIHFLDFKHFFF